MSAYSGVRLRVLQVIGDAAVAAGNAQASANADRGDVPGSSIEVLLESILDGLQPPFQPDQAGDGDSIEGQLRHRLEAASDQIERLELALRCTVVALTHRPTTWVGVQAAAGWVLDG